MGFGVLLMLIAGCGGDDSTVLVDSGTDAQDAARDAAVDSALAVSPVAAPSLPAWDCPATWRRVSAEDIAPDLVRCEPWPEVETPCAPHEVRMPGDAACHSVGTPCPADGWPAGLPEAGVVYVRPGATATPDGTRAAPYADTTAALAALSPDTTTLALSVGEYPARIVLASPLTIRGACPEGTVLTGPVRPLLVEDAGRIRIENLMVRGASLGALVIRDSSAEIRQVAFDNVTTIGVRSDFIIEDVVARGRGESTINAFINISDTLETSIARVFIENAAGDGIFLGGDGALSLADVYVRGALGAGMILWGDVTLERVAVDDVTELGVLGFTGGQMTDVVVRDVEPYMGDSGGVALVGDWVIDGLHVSRTGSVGIVATEGSLELNDAIVGGPAAGDTSLGRGIEVGAGGSFAGTRILVTDVRDLGLLADHTGPVSLTDVTFRRIDENLLGGFGRCVHGQFDARITIERGVFEDCTEAAVTTAADATATLRDVHVRNIRPTGCGDMDGGCVGSAGIGLLAVAGGAIDAERFIIEGAALAGVIIVAEGDMDLRDGTIRDSPIGLNLQDPAYDLSRATDRVIFSDNSLNLDSSALPLPAATP
ncbi:MAG: hypothetical protein DRJ42_13715 [Deltaproteobacteria bacterium]|nr:MAG: hypothetical protein DRJ42_13715 [Deltaproteobacteria bacterium]